MNIVVVTFFRVTAETMVPALTWEGICGCHTKDRNKGHLQIKNTRSQELPAMTRKLREKKVIRVSLRS